MRSVKTSKFLKPKHVTTIADWDNFLYKSRMFKSCGRPFFKRPGFLLSFTAYVFRDTQ